MSQEQLDRYFKDTIELIHNNSKDYFKEDEMDEVEYRKCMGDILKTFLNKYHTFQSQSLFANINGVKFNKIFNEDRKDKDNQYKYKINHFDFDNKNDYELNKDDFNMSNIGSPIVDLSDVEIAENSLFSSFDINDIIRHQNAIDSYSNFNDYGHSSDPEFETQCCARVDDEWFKIDDYSSEFLDKYPAGVFITNDGYVVGNPCPNMIPDEEFDEGKIFCDAHNFDEMCEDIRELPIKTLNRHK